MNEHWPILHISEFLKHIKIRLDMWVKRLDCLAAIQKLCWLWLVQLTFSSVCVQVKTVLRNRIDRFNRISNCKNKMYLHKHLIFIKWSHTAIILELICDDLQRHCGSCLYLNACSIAGMQPLLSAHIFPHIYWLQLKLSHTVLTIEGTFAHFTGITEKSQE